MSKLYKTKTDPELFYYFNSKKEKMWMFRHRYYDTFGKRRERSKRRFKKENEAYRELLKVKSSILNGEEKQVENSNLTISEWLDVWYETKKPTWKITTSSERKRIIDNIIKPLIGKYKLSKLDLMTYERVLINKLLKKYQPSTVKYYHTVFKIAVNAAVINKTIKENNFISVNIPDKKIKIENYLSQTDLNILLDTGKSLLDITKYTLLLLLATTGMRKGEGYGLRWNDIDYRKKTLKIERTRDYLGVRSPKTKNSYREIPINDKLIGHLKSYHIWCKKLKLFYGEHLSKDDYIFISHRGGKPVGQATINRTLDLVIKETSIKRITPHGLRHTHATILLNKKVSIATVAKRLGNTAEEIHRTYGHSDDHADREAMEIFDSVINM